MSEQVTIPLVVVDQASSALDKVAASAGRLKGQTDSLKGGFQEFGDVTRAVSPQMAELTSRFQGAAASLSKLSGAGGAALGAAAGFAAVGAAATVAWRGMRDLILAAKENSAELVKAGLITREQAKDIDKAAEAHRMFGIAIDTVGARAAAAASEGFAHFTLGVTAMTLALSGVPWDQVKEDLRAIKDAASEAFVEWEGAPGLFPSLSASKDEIMELSDAIHAEAEKVAEEAAEAHEERLAHIEEESEAQQEAMHAWQESMAETGQIAADLHQQMMDDLGEQTSATVAAAQAEQKARTEQQTAWSKASSENQKQVADNQAQALSIYADAAGVISGLITSQFEDAKAAALVQVAIDTALGIVKSIATLGPPVPPNFAGIAGVIATTAIGVTQAAIIAGKSLGGGGGGTINTQSKHIGGTVTSEGRPPPGGMPYERMVRARVGEVFGTPEQMSARGGGGSINLIQLGDNVWEAATDRQLRRADSSLARAITGGSAFQRRLLGAG